MQEARVARRPGQVARADRGDCDAEGTAGKGMQAQNADKNAAGAGRNLLYFLVLLSVVGVLASLAYHRTQHEWVQYRRAERHFVRGEFGRAAELYEPLRGTEVPEARVLQRLVSCYEAIGDFERALRACEGLAAEAPSDFAVVHRLAVLYVMLDRFDGATRSYGGFLERQPDHRNARVHLARVLTWSGRFEDAVREYRRALGGTQ